MSNEKLYLDDWVPINDGRGVIGYGFECKKCKEFNRFVSDWKDSVTCDNCATDYAVVDNP